MRSLPSLGLLAAVAAVAAAGAGGAGCGDDERVLIELQGAAPEARRVDVLLLDPVVLGKLQRRNDGEPATPGARNEVVTYLAQRAVVSFEVDGEGLDGLRFEVRDAGGPYAPLAIARDAAGAPIAMGVYSPASITRTMAGEERLADVVGPVGDVAVYALALEPVAQVAEPPPDGAAVIRRGQVLPVRCGATQALSGLSWRRADGAQIRVAVPLGGAGGAALERIDPPDLDCDDHSPGVRSVERHALGDQLDCDDTTPAVHAGQRERCSSARVDEDCDPLTIAAEVPCGATPCALDLCKCTDADPTPDCIVERGAHCTVPATTSGGALYTPCESRGEIPIDECTVRDCDLVLLTGLAGIELKLNGAPMGQTVSVAAGGRIELALRATASYPLGSVGSVGIQVTPKPAPPRSLVVEVDLAEGACSSSAAIACEAQ